MKYFTQEVRHGALLFLESTNEIHFTFAAKHDLRVKLRQSKKLFINKSIHNRTILI